MKKVCFFVGLAVLATAAHAGGDKGRVSACGAHASGSVSVRTDVKVRQVTKTTVTQSGRDFSRNVVSKGRDFSAGEYRGRPAVKTVTTTIVKKQVTRVSNEAPKHESRYSFEHKSGEGIFHSSDRRNIVDFNLVNNRGGSGEFEMGSEAPAILASTGGHRGGTDSGSPMGGNGRNEREGSRSVRNADFFSEDSNPGRSDLDFDRVTRGGNSGDDGVLVCKDDTKPVPEPATMTVLGIAGIAALLRKRRK